MSCCGALAECVLKVHAGVLYRDRYVRSGGLKANTHFCLDVLAPVMFVAALGIVSSSTRLGQDTPLALQSHKNESHVDAMSNDPFLDHFLQDLFRV